MEYIYSWATENLVWCYTVLVADKVVRSPLIGASAYGPQQSP